MVLSGCNNLADLSSSGLREGRPLIEDLGVNDPVDPTPAPVVRPDGQVIVQNNYCICLNGEAASLGNCDAFCQNRNVDVPTLFVNTALGPDIQLNEGLGSLLNWCTVQIDDGNINPNCQLEARDDLTTINFDVTLFSDVDSFSAVVQDLDLEKTYILRLVEQSSGAASTAFQVKRITPSSDSNPQGILRTIPIDMYTCINGAGVFDNGSATYEFAVRQYFFFPNNSDPPVIPPTQLPPSVYCHDIFTEGNVDSPSFRRLELLQGHFYMWDQSDVRFFDVNNNQRFDINEEINQTLVDRFNFASNDALTVFTDFNWPSFPLATTPSGLGFVMIPFIDEDTNEVFCPTINDYENGTEIFQVLGELVGVETEALFIARKEDEIFEDGGGNPITGPPGFMFIRQSQLEQIWFYFDNSGQPIFANEDLARTETIHYFWPPCEDTTCSPTVRAAGQRLFTIRASNDLSDLPASDEQIGFRSSIQPADKRVACVPRG